MEDNEEELNKSITFPGSALNGRWEDQNKLDKAQGEEVELKDLDEEDDEEDEEDSDEDYKYDEYEDFQPTPSKWLETFFKDVSIYEYYY